jgi:hypothetical protein
VFFRIQSQRIRFHDHHPASIELVLDVLYNHTGKGDSTDPTNRFHQSDRVCVTRGILDTFTREATGSATTVSPATSNKLAIGVVRSILGSVRPLLTCSAFSRSLEIEMKTSPALRKFVLTSHVTSSVGWLGAVACFVVLACVGLRSVDEMTARATYISMGWMAWFVILPLSFVSPLSGIVQSLTTRWGLFRHYWIVAKLLITIPSTLILILHMDSIQFLAGIAHEGPLFDRSHDELRRKLLAASIGAVIALFIATALSVYKPLGVIPSGVFGARDTGSSIISLPRWMMGALTIIGLALALAVIAHVSGMHHAGH